MAFLLQNAKHPEVENLENAVAAIDGNTPNIGERSRHTRPLIKTFLKAIWETRKSSISNSAPLRNGTGHVVSDMHCVVNGQPAEAVT